MPKKIEIKSEERWDEDKEEFVPGISTTIMLEHSLISLQKWEAKWHKPFLTEKPHTLEEVIDYIKCMTLTQNVKDEVYDMLTPDNIKEIEEYIDDDMTATTFREDESRGGGVIDRSKITAELLYYWMIQHNIPYECRKWHLGQLITLIRVCGIKAEEANNQGKKKRLTDAELARRSALNKARREAVGSKG